MVNNYFPIHFFRSVNTFIFKTEISSQKAINYRTSKTKKNHLHLGRRPMSWTNSNGIFTIIANTPTQF